MSQSRWQVPQIEALYVGGSRLPGWDGAALAIGTNGLANIPVAPGPNPIRIVYHPSPAGPTEVLNFSLNSTEDPANTGTITGTVIDLATGQPVAGALVTIQAPLRDFVVVSGADASFSLTTTPGNVQVDVVSEGFQVAMESTTLIAGATTSLSVGLVPWGVDPGDLPGGTPGGSATMVAGNVTDASTGAPLEGATISIVASDGTSVFTFSQIDGSYSIGGIAQGAFEMTVSLAGFTPEIWTFTGTVTSDLAFDIALEALPNSLVVAGSTISDLTGIAEEGVVVTLLSTGEVTVTGTSGDFVFSEAPLGLQTFRFEKSGFVDLYVTANLVPQLNGLPVTLPVAYPEQFGFSGSLAAPPNATGTVLDSTKGQPVPGAILAVGTQTVVSDASGQFAFTGLSTGLTTVAVSAPGFGIEELSVFIVPGGSDELSFFLDSLAPGSIQGLISDASSGEPIEMATVGFLGGAPLQEANTFGDGSYGIPGVPAGTTGVVVSHPQFEPGMATISVTADLATVLDVALAPLPTQGNVFGRILDDTTGNPLVGASVTELASGSTTVTNSEGDYRLDDLPSGLVELSIAASGRPSASRFVSIVPHPSADTIAFVEANFRIDSAGDEPPAAGIVTASVGGTVSTPGGEMSVSFPPGTLSQDAEVFIFPSANPAPTPGGVLSLDPLLIARGAGTTIPLGREMTLRLEAVGSDTTTPKLNGPVVLTMAYSAEDVANTGVREESLAPFVLSGSDFTLPLFLPHMYAVDKRLRKVVVGVLPSVGQFGGAIAGTPRNAFAQYAQATAPPGIDPSSPFSIDYRWVLASALESAFDPNARVAWTDLVNDSATPTVLKDSIHEGAFPVLFFSGWSPVNTVFNIDPSAKPFPDNDRYGPMITDILDEVKGVYRPIYVANNGRAAISGTALEVKRKLNPFLRTVKEKYINKDPDRSGVSAFGYSQGVLVARAYQSASRVSLPGGKTRGPIDDAVLMGGPNHGSLQGAVDFLTQVDVARTFEAISDFPAGVIPSGLPEVVINGLDTYSDWAPGTVNLFDYDNRTGIPNPWLAGLNNNGKSVADFQTMLIGGTDRRLLGPRLSPFILPNSVDVSLGDWAVRDDKGIHDGTVPLFSALGKIQLGTATSSERVAARSIPVLSRAERHDEPFGHQSAGTAQQRVIGYAEEFITNKFQDAVVVAENLVAQPILCGDENIATTIEQGSGLEWNTPDDGFTGAALVAYVQDGNGQWRIEAGADSNGTLTQNGSAILAFSESNSADLHDPLNSADPTGLADRTIKIDPVSLAVFDPNEKSTVVQDVQFIVYKLGKLSEITDTVSLDPTEELGFEPRAPGDLICPCPDPNAPACQ